MSRRIKPDRRNPLERNSVVEIINLVEYPGIPQEFVKQLKYIRKSLIYHVERFENECYRNDLMREELTWIMFIDELDLLTRIMQEYNLIPDEYSPKYSGFES